MSLCYKHASDMVCKSEEVALKSSIHPFASHLWINPRIMKRQIECDLRIKIKFLSNYYLMEIDP